MLPKSNGAYILYYMNMKLGYIFGLLVDSRVLEFKIRGGSVVPTSELAEVGTSDLVSKLGKANEEAEGES
jgi:hypothetical protein